MSLRDILLDKVKGKIYHDLHYESFGDQLRGKISLNRHSRTLEKWDPDHVSDVVDAIIRANKDSIYTLIDDIAIQNNLNLKTLDDRLINAVAEKIESSLLILDDKVDSYIGLPDIKLMPEFPFNTRSLLQMCWGMTLNLSDEKTQSDLGAVFKNQFFTDDGKGNWDKISRLEVDLSDPTSIFLMNLKMALSSTVRNLGFIISTHSSYLKYNGSRLIKRRSDLEKIANLADFTDSGLFAKLAVFFGAGSSVTIGSLFSGFGKNLTDTALTYITIAIFAASGLLGAILLTLSVRWYVNRTDDTWDRKVRLDQNRYWKEHYKKDVINELYNLYISIIGLIEKFYPDKKKDIMDNDELLIKHNVPELVKKIISKFLPPDNLQWFPSDTDEQTSLQSA